MLFSPFEQRGFFLLYIFLTSPCVTYLVNLNSLVNNSCSLRNNVLTAQTKRLKQQKSDKLSFSLFFWREREQERRSFLKRRAGAGAPLYFSSWSGSESWSVAPFFVEERERRSCAVGRWSPLWNGIELYTGLRKRLTWLGHVLSVPSKKTAPHLPSLASCEDFS